MAIGEGCSCQTRQPAEGELEDQPVGDGPQRRETAIDLFSVLLRLPPEHRSVLSLYYIEGFGIAEVASDPGDPGGYRQVAAPLGTCRVQGSCGSRRVTSD